MENDENDELDSLYYGLSINLFETPIFSPIPYEPRSITTPYTIRDCHYCLEIELDEPVFRNNEWCNQIIEDVKQILADYFMDVEKVYSSNRLYFETNILAIYDKQGIKAKLDNYKIGKNEIISMDFFMR